MTDREQGVSAAGLAELREVAADTTEPDDGEVVVLTSADCRAILAALADAARLDWLHDHYARFVSSVATGRKDGGWDTRTKIRWRVFNDDPMDDGWREQQFDGDFRAAIDAARAAEGEAT
jgi:hypothetical protein